MKNKQLWDVTSREWDLYINAYSLLLRDIREIRSNININVWNEIAVIGAQVESNLQVIIKNLQINSRSATE